MKVLRSFNHPLGLCTNKPQRPTLALLDLLGWRDLFGTVLGGDAVPRHKPDPAHLRAVLTLPPPTPRACR